MRGMMGTPKEEFSSPSTSVEAVRATLSPYLFINTRRVTWVASAGSLKHLRHQKNCKANNKLQSICKPLPIPRGTRLDGIFSGYYLACGSYKGTTRPNGFNWYTEVWEDHSPLFKSDFANTDAIHKFAKSSGITCLSNADPRLALRLQRKAKATRRR